MALARKTLTASRNSISTDINTTLDTSPQNAVDIENIRARFPGLPEGTALFNNAAGTVVLRDAIERYVRLLDANLARDIVYTDSLLTVNAVPAT